jgi:hypothetical protein
MVLAKSAQVSVNAQKYGGLLLQPIGRLRGKPMRGSTVWSGGKMTASSSAAEALKGMR